jgi:hypothetical protein
VPGANTSKTNFSKTDDCSNFFKFRHQKYRRVGGLLTYIVQVLGEKEKKEEKQEIEIVVSSLLGSRLNGLQCYSGGCVRWRKIWQTNQ